MKTEAGPAMQSFTRKGDVFSFDKRQSKDLFTRMAEVAELSCCTASSSGNFMLLKHTKARKKFASTLHTETSPRYSSTVTRFNGATGQPLFKRQWGRFDCLSGGLIRCCLTSINSHAVGRLTLPHPIAATALSSKTVRSPI